MQFAPLAEAQRNRRQGFREDEQLLGRNNADSALGRIAVGDFSKAPQRKPTAFGGQHLFPKRSEACSPFSEKTQTITPLLAVLESLEMSSFRSSLWRARINYDEAVGPQPVRRNAATLAGLTRRTHRRRPMFSRSMQMALSVLAVMPAGAQHAPDVAAPTHDVASSNSALDVPIEDIASSGTGCAILDKDFPRLRSHPMYGFFKVMSLNQIAAMSHGEITPGMLAQAQTDLSVLSLKAAAVDPTDIEDPAPPAGQAQLSGPR